MEFWEALKPHRPYWRGILLLLMVGAVSVGVYHFFFACSRVHASATPDHLEVERTGDLNANGMFPQAPGDWVFGPGQAQEVLSAIDSLPAATTDTRFCPLSDGTVFRYIFRRASAVVLQASAEGRGCEVLNLSTCDTRQEDGNFLLLMERLLNLPSI